jgi:hypothetical protein
MDRLLSLRLVPVAAVVALMCGQGIAVAGTGPSKTVEGGQTWVVPETTRLHTLTLAAGGIISAPDGHSLTLTVNGVETGSYLPTAAGVDTAIAAGTYRGDIVVTVAEATPLTGNGLTFPFRQGLYVDSTGVIRTKSVIAAVVGGRFSDDGARDIRVSSTGAAFNGVFVKDRAYTLTNPTFRLNGNGRSDFVGYGAAIVGTGTATKLVVDGADIQNKGVVRTAVVADGGSNVVVKNSRIHVDNGVLPPDYVSTVDTSKMLDVPWMLGLSGNNRATNLLGTNTKASYIASNVSSEGWGVLSTDNGSNGQLTAINSDVANTGQDGYGSYAIGNATERFLGTRLDVATYAAINRGGSLYYGDSTRKAIEALNGGLDLGLTAKEIKALRERNTVVNSRRFGIMWHGAGSATIDGHTVINTKETTFLDKGQAVDITVDGSQGARVTPANGVVLQVMEDDDPGPQMVNGQLVNSGVYTEPTGDATKVTSFDVTAVHDADAVATFTDTTLKGDFYNAIRGGSTGGGGPMGGGVSGKNLVLTFHHTKVTGMITASRSEHAQPTITSADYKMLGMVTNYAQAIVNNGVIVTLDNGSTWTATGTSHLSKLAVGADAAVKAPAGRTVTMTVDGVATAITPGTTYTGEIVLTVS